jgi:hypothetical protein
VGIHGHWEGYGRLVVTGFSPDGYPQGVPVAMAVGRGVAWSGYVGEGLAAAGEAWGLERIARLAGCAR